MKKGASFITPRRLAVTDEQRLDWLETVRATISFAGEGPWGAGGPHVCVDPVRANDGDESVHYFGKTFRDAIDKAMKGTAQ